MPPDKTPPGGSRPQRPPRSSEPPIPPPGGVRSLLPTAPRPPESCGSAATLTLVGGAVSAGCGARRQQGEEEAESPEQPPRVATPHGWGPPSAPRPPSGRRGTPRRDPRPPPAAPPGSGARRVACVAAGGCPGRGERIHRRRPGARRRNEGEREGGEGCGSPVPHSREGRRRWRGGELRQLRAEPRSWAALQPRRSAAGSSGSLLRRPRLIPGRTQRRGASVSHSGGGSCPAAGLLGCRRGGERGWAPPHAPRGINKTCGAASPPPLSPLCLSLSAAAALMRSPPLAPDLRVALPAAAFGAAAPPPSGTALARRVPVSREGGAAPRRGRSGTGGPPAKRAAGSARGEARGGETLGGGGGPSSAALRGECGREVRGAPRRGEGRDGRRRGAPSARSPRVRCGRLGARGG